MKKALIILALLTFLLSSMAPGLVIRPPLDTNPPAAPVRLIFIHHSTGGNWLADPASNELGGGLGKALMDNNYYVSATNYSWGPDSIGDATDIPNWPDWFLGERSAVYLDALYAEDGQNFGDFGSWPRLDANPGGENRIIVFKSCFPNSELEGRPNEKATADGWLTVGHAKYVYNELLTYFATRPDKLFVVVTAPPLSSSSNGKNARAFNNWLVNDWLAENDYTLKNVAVFDYYNVLTGPDNHHRIVEGQVQHVYTEGQNLEYYPSGDDHPSRAGNEKATQEFIPMLNAFYNTWAETAPDAPPAAEGNTQASTETASDDQSVELTAAAFEGGGFSEDFENGAPGWEAFHDDGGGTRITCAASGDEAYAGKQSLKVDFDVAKDGWATCGISFDQPQDWSSSQGLSYVVQTMPRGMLFHVDVYAGSPEDRQSYFFEMQVPETSADWSPDGIPWEAFKRVDWEENAGQPLTNTDQILGIAFGIPTQAQGTLWVDDIRLMGSAAESAAAPEAAATEESAPAEPKKGLCSSAIVLPLGAAGVGLWQKKRVKRSNP